MRSSALRLAVPGYFCLAQCPPDPSMLLQMTGYPSSCDWCHMFFTADGDFGCFDFFAILNSVAAIDSRQMSLWFYFLSLFTQLWHCWVIWKFCFQFCLSVWCWESNLEPLASQASAQPLDTLALSVTVVVNLHNVFHNDCIIFPFL